MNKNQILKLIANLSQDIDKMPLIIELTGTPNSGKTSIINEIDTAFRRFHIKCKVIQESAQYCEISGKLSPQFNYWTALETIQKILIAINQGYKIMICDRGIFDAITWMRFYLNEKQISNKDYTSSIKFYLSNEWREFTQCIVIMTCNSQTAIERDLDYTDFGKYGTIVNPTVLDKINVAINDTINDYSGQFYRVMTYDTTRNIDSVSKEITAQILDYLLFYLQ